MNPIVNAMKGRAEKEKNKGKKKKEQEEGPKNKERGNASEAPGLRRKRKKGRNEGATVIPSESAVGR